MLTDMNHIPPWSLRIDISCVRIIGEQFRHLLSRFNAGFGHLGVEVYGFVTLQGNAPLDSAKTWPRNKDLSAPIIDVKQKALAVYIRSWGRTERV
jgi:hypothetical protein